MIPSTMISLFLAGCGSSKIVKIYKPPSALLYRERGLVVSVSSYKVKCLVMGDSCIDTWNLIAGHLQNSFGSRYKNTIGCDIGTMSVQLPYERVIMSIWDIAPSERFRFFRRAYFRGASCALLAFDLTRYNSFNPTLINFITELYSYVGAIPVILVGCYEGEATYRQVPQNEIDELCEQMANVTYVEIDTNNEIALEIFETVAEQTISRLGFTEEERRLAYEWHQKHLETLRTTLEEMNFRVTDRDEVEILTHRGFFSVNILNGNVKFEPIICNTCGHKSCQYKKTPRHKSLCIISDGPGWSNLELANHELLLLAKIFAIVEDNLPLHVLNQMHEVEFCAHYTKGAEIDDIHPTFHTRDLSEFTPHVVIGLEFQQIGSLFERVTPSEANTLLRNYQMQFYEGRLPYSVYTILKERLEQIKISEA